MHLDVVGMKSFSRTLVDLHVKTDRCDESGLHVLHHIL